jgi:hypothetical protein
MQKRKTQFDQVPVEVAEKVLRQQTSEPKAVATGCLLLRNPAPTRVSRIRRLRRRRLYSEVLGDRLIFIVK